jgi:hypothetical protein
MAFWIIAGVVLFLIGTLTWLLPSPRERKQMELRQTAIKMGLKVSLGELSTVIEAGTEQGVKCVVYQLPTEVSPHVLWQAVREQHQRGVDIASDGLPSGWYWAKGDIPEPSVRAYLQSALPLLNQDVLAIEARPIGYAVYWREHGSADDVAQFAKLLHTLRDTN